MIETSEHCLA